MEKNQSSSYRDRENHNDKSNHYNRNNHQDSEDAHIILPCTEPGCHHVSRTRREFANHRRYECKVLLLL